MNAVRVHGAFAQLDLNKEEHAKDFARRKELRVPKTADPTK